MDNPSSAPPSTPADKVDLTYSGAVGSAASAGAAPGQPPDAPSEPTPGTTAIRSVPNALETAPEPTPENSATPVPPAPSR